ncbi:hypothetical protein [Spirosoma sordidisoli]|uniref:Uncharacterized protein n=1 Tax=Spirosoma sordidisoli TaxID=2502893 RepID=A0A4Q2UJT7_9BACT|nr:hypothetical protein [Spirosoma sordidisoli]RYC69763.1 hypothetical protein EQG79_14300 [Spirosoma sordidisoli]
MEDTNKAPEVTIESLQAQLDQERAEHQATKAERDAALESKDDAASALDTANRSLVEATQIIAGQKVTIAEQEATIVSLQTNPAQYPIIKVGKKSYEVTTKTFQYKKVEYTVEQLLADTKLQKELVEKGMGFLVEVGKEA